MAKNLSPGPHEDGQTPLDEGLNNLEAQNNAKAYAKHLLYSRSGKKAGLLNSNLLCEIHRDMFGEVWSWAGEFRKGGEKNIGVPAVKIGSELHRLLADAHKWEEEKIPSIEIAVRIHHRLVEIHPFENGNGRWARLVTNLYLHRQNYPLIEWPSDPRLMREVFKPKYLTALKKADRGDYSLLSELHKEYTKE
ncbi:MAG: mobile mystery protein B [Candidatus Omnitrophica bacterium]|nr:mobile mystery protein B [Candidatus Omnitrophota bacterium]